MKTLKTFAVSAAVAATMLFSVNADAARGDWTLQQCWDLSGRIDAAYTSYLNAQATGNATAIAWAYRYYQQLNSQYNTYCWGVPHAY